MTFAPVKTMQVSIKTFSAFRPQPELQEIFAYRSQGLPGLDIIGLGSKGKKLKEKFIFLTKERRLKIPLRRYILCVEGDVKEVSWLEFPLLLCFWSLAEVLPIRNLKNCLTVGSISIQGLITHPFFTQEDHCFIRDHFKENNFTLIQENDDKKSPIKTLSSSHLMASISNISIQSKNLNRKMLNHFQ